MCRLDSLRLLLGAIVLCWLGLTELSVGADLVGDWSFDEGVGTVAHDRSAYHDNGYDLISFLGARPGKFLSRVQRPAKRERSPGAG